MASPVVDISQLSKSQQEVLREYKDVTNQENAPAISILQQSKWNIEVAITRFYDGDQANPAPPALPVQNVATNVGFLPKSDLGILMQNAMKEYYASLPKDLPMDPEMKDPTKQPKSIADVKLYVGKHVTNFKSSRHDGSMGDKIRTAIGKSLGVVQSISNVMGFAVGISFPPAAPIFTAINCLVFAGNSVSADYSNLEDFLGEVGDCLNSISIVEGYLDKGTPIPQLKLDFTNVFAAILKLCGVATTFIHEGRLTRAFLRSTTGNDRGLGDANLKLKSSMLNLGRSIQNGTFIGVVQLNESMSDLRRQSEEMLGKLNSISDNVGQLSGKLDQAVGMVKDMATAKATRIVKFLESYGGGQAVLESWWEDKKREYVAGTADWMLRDHMYTEWCGEGGDAASWGRGNLSVLWVYGGTGMGKSMLAYKVQESLLSYAQVFRISIASFSFQQSEKKVSLAAAISNAILQISDIDDLYRSNITEVIRATEGGKSESMSTLGLWNKFIAEQYADSGRYRRGKLYLLLDGIEEMNSNDQRTLQEIVTQIIKNKLNVKLLLFGDSEVNGDFGRIGDVELPCIEVTSERIRDAIKLFIDNRVEKFKISPPLPDPLKEQIRSTLGGREGGFAFVSASLDDIENTEQAEDIPDKLDSLPLNFRDLLDKKVDVVLRKLSTATKDRLYAIKIILYWCAFSGGLTVKQLKCVLAMKTRYKAFNVEGEVNKTCGSLLELIDRKGDKGDDSATESKTEDNSTENDSKNDSAAEADNDRIVKFIEPGFAKCLKDYEWTAKAANSIIEIAEVAAFDIATTLMKVVSMSPTDPSYSTTRDLESYAAGCYTAPLREIDLDKASHEHIQEMVKSMREAFSAKETTSWALDRLMQGTLDSVRASTEVQDEEANSDGPGVVENWCVKALELGEEKLVLSAADWEWAKEVANAPPGVRQYLVHLAGELIQHWFAEAKSNEIVIKFGFALGFTLGVQGKHKSNEEWNITESDIITLPEFIPGYKPDENSYRAIGLALSDQDFVTSAVEYLLKALEISSSPQGEFFTSTALGYAYCAANQFKESEEILNKALEIWKELSKTDNSELLNNRLCLLYTYLGDTLTSSDYLLTESERAIAAYEQAMSLNRENPTLKTAILAAILGTLIKTHNMKGLLDKVCGWDPKSFSEWLLYDIDTGSQREDVLKVAIEQGRVSTLIDCYTAATKAASKGGGALLIQVELGSMYWKVMGNEDMAHEELSKVVYSTEVSAVAKEAKHGASLILSEMMYGKIQKDPAVWVRRVLTTSMALISQKDAEKVQEVWDLSPNIALAAAYLACNQRADAVKLLDVPFSLCVEWLGDDVEYNDSSSLRLLSKILACVGLHRDARIAYSATFSKLATYLDSEKDQEYRSSLVNLHEYDEQVDEGRGDTDKVEDPDSQDIENGANESPEDAKEPSVTVKQAVVNGKDNVTEPQGAADQTPAEEANGNTEPQQNTAAPAEEAKGTTEQQDGTAPTEEANGAHEQPDARPAASSSNRHRLIPADTEDIVNFPNCCNGCSRPFYDFWDVDEPLYMCIICRNIDLCKACYAKRTAPLTDATASSSSSAPIFCGLNHDYVKVPIEGWRGIKDGVMTVDPEKMQFRHWLADVERKWKDWKDTGVVSDKP